MAVKTPDRIHGMTEAHPNIGPAVAQRPGLPMSESRLEMMRRVKRMSLEQRVELFERISRDAAWIRTATRIR
jgi:hypothetical protein